jgi:predicted DNA-binding transcriptional regulator AlpA
VGERRIPASDLVGTQEIADRLGLAHRQTVLTLMRRHADFPEPITVIGSVRIWAWTDVEAWARRNGRYPVDD